MYMKILLTGFEPFGKQTINPSEEVVKMLENVKLGGIELSTANLAVERYKGPQGITQAYSDSKPDAVLCLGEGGTYTGLYIERVFVNLLDSTMKDNGGHTATDEVINAKGPDALFSTLPVRRIHDALKEADIPSKLSLSAGTYICNQVGYTLMDLVRQSSYSIPAGFIHLPFLPKQAAPYRECPSMDISTMCKGIQIVLETISESAHPAV